MYLYMLSDHISAMRQQEWEMRAQNNEARRFLNRAVRTIDHRRFPEATALAQPEECTFTFIKHELRGPDKKFSMLVMDWPGEWYQEPEKSGSALMDYLKRCQGILCLIDPDRDENEPFMAYLVTLLNDLQFASGGNRIDKKLAFCLTKMDEPQHRHWLHLPNAYIRQKLGERLVQRVLDACAPGRVSFDFACSAVGFYPASNPPRSNSGIDFMGEAILYDAGNIKPFGVFDPLEKWLFKD